MIVRCNINVAAVKITATDAARETLALLKARHGEIILHVTGGWSKMPLAFAVGELKLGPRDVRLGEIDGVAVYEMQHTPEGLHGDDAYVLDVVAGVRGAGFRLWRRMG